MTIAFGFDENGTAVITLNGTIVGHTNSISANNFLNKEGYISVVTYNGSSPTQCNWAYTIAVSETDNAVPVWQEDGENDDNGGQTPEDPPQGSSCSGSVVGTGTLLAAAAVLFGVFAVLKKKNKENRE